ncbi:DUF4328 domain-containing protein [Streptomyces sp. NPDC006529]|uniref:DUF4328 domain-containing protein n=1 Tax=Streptomyces sp. NPDC006529 TaxID=3157177 RepID=UPI0033B093FC
MSYDATSAPGPSGAPGPYDPPVPGSGPVAPAPALRSPSGLGLAVTILLGVAGVVDLAAALIGLGKGAGVSDIAVGDGTEALSGDALLSGSVALVQLVLLLGTGIVFIIWFHRVRVNGGVFRPDLFGNGPGWAIGSWFIPIGNLFLPFRIAKQTWQASVQYGPDGSARALGVTPVTVWWFTFIGSNLVGRASEAGGDLLSAVSAVFAVLFVRKLTALQVTKATEGPNALA